MLLGAAAGPDRGGRLARDGDRRARRPRLDPVGAAAPPARRRERRARSWPPPPTGSARRRANCCRGSRSPANTATRTRRWRSCSATTTTSTPSRPASSSRWRCSAGAATLGHCRGARPGRRGARRLRAGGPDRHGRGGRRAGRRPHRPRPAGGPGGAGHGAAGRVRARRAPVRRRRSRATSKCSTRSARCSRRNSPCAGARRQYLDASVQLYKAIGGRWPSHPVTFRGAGRIFRASAPDVVPRSNGPRHHGVRHDVTHARLPARLRRRGALPFCAGLALGLAAPMAAQEQVDAATVQRIMTEEKDHSQVMDIMSWLSDVYGPRLTWSPNVVAGRGLGDGRDAHVGTDERPRGAVDYASAASAGRMSASR